MFYADFVLSKKGPLARIWLAAHWDKKLTRAQIFETNVESSIERILKPKVKLALRTSGHLMLGVVRIYSRKTKYLLADCNEVFLKIKSAFRPGMLDLPEDHREAVVTAFTQSVVFPDFDSVMPDLDNVDIEAQFTLNQSRVDEITMADDYGTNTLLNVDGGGFGGDGFGAPGDTDGAVDSHQANAFFGGSIEGFDKHDGVAVTDSHLGANLELDKNNGFDSFGGVLYEDAPMGDSLMDGSAFHDQIQPDGAIPSTSKDTARLDSPMNDDDDFDDHYAPPSPRSSNGSQPPSPIAAITGTDPTPAVGSAVDQFLSQNDLVDQQTGQNNDQNLNVGSNQNLEGVDGTEKQTDQTTLLQNEEESFALAPVDASALKGLPKSKRKRKLIVDEVKNISGDEMKAQLSDTTDIVITLDLAPPTKRLMHWKETGGVEKLFALPGKSIPSTSLFKNYQRHLISKAVPNEENEDREHLDVTREGVQDRLDITATEMPPPSRRGRKRKNAEIEDKQDQLVSVPTEDAEKRPQLEDLRLSTNFEEPPSYHSLPNDSLTSQILDQPPVSTSTSNLSDETIISNAQNEPPAAVEDIFSTLHDNQNFDNLNSSAGKDNMMENMGYDGQDQEFGQNFSDINNPITPGLNAGGITPWHDNDYDNPVSVEPQDERGDDETVEQFEERVLNKRAGQLSSTIRMRITTGAETTFDDLTKGNSRKQVAQKFYSLLVLKKYRVIELTQEEPYAPILLTKGSNFDDPKLCS